MCAPVQLEDGDIICFQKSVPAENVSYCRHQDVPSFLEYVHNRQVVLSENFKQLSVSFLDMFLELAKKDI